VEESSHYLIPVPGGADGPSGVLVCSEVGPPPSPLLIPVSRVGLPGCLLIVSLFEFLFQRDRILVMEFGVLFVLPSLYLMPFIV
jgi:hypothetical protein